MADNKVVRAQTTEKVLRIDDKLLKKISDKAYALRLKSDQTLMRQILEEYFDKNSSKNKDVETEKLKKEITSLKQKNWDLESEIRKEIIEKENFKEKYEKLLKEISKNKK